MIKQAFKMPMQAVQERLLALSKWIAHFSTQASPDAAKSVRVTSFISRHTVKVII